ncbi:MAG: nucleotidyltransferase family protein, partial [Clostridia bacterium]|nr:nucleotidyltransferase family protein [Clostridia bacterium]
ITSASSIRNAIKQGERKKIKKSVPPFTYQDVKDYPFAFDKLILSSVVSTTTENLAKIADCTEGLENRIKALCKDNHTIDGLVEKVSTKRYTKTRINRILTANFLGIEKNLVKDCLENKLYAKILAVDSNSKDLISLIAKKGNLPVLTRKSDTEQLKKTALKCFEKDALACDLYSLATDIKLNENSMLTI